MQNHDSFRLPPCTRTKIPAVVYCEIRSYQVLLLLGCHELKLKSTLRRIDPIRWEGRTKSTLCVARSINTTDSPKGTCPRFLLLYSHGPKSRRTSPHVLCLFLSYIHIYMYTRHWMYAQSCVCVCVCVCRLHCMDFFFSHDFFLLTTTPYPCSFLLTPHIVQQRHSFGTNKGSLKLSSVPQDSNDKWTILSAQTTKASWHHGSAYASVGSWSSCLSFLTASE